jgi:hypothetical protein
VRPQTKLLIAAVIAVLFAGFVLRAAVRLVSVALHSFFFAILLVVVIVWIVAKTSRS